MKTKPKPKPKPKAKPKAKKRRRKCRKCQAYCNGRPGLCGLFAQGNRFRGYTTPGSWPIASTSQSVLPGQVQEAMAADRKLGVPTEYKLATDGYSAAPLFRSSVHQRAWCRAHGKTNYDDNM